MGNLMTCTVRYHEHDFPRSVDVVATSLFEAVALGIKAMNIPSSQIHCLSFDVKVQAPQVWHSVSGAALNAWLARDAKTADEEMLKARVRELIA